jgi:uncharacterized protein YlaI
MKCISCESELSALDVALTKKLINRGAEQYMCIDCLAKKFSVSTDLLLEKAEHFKNTGCLLFEGITIKK